MRKSFFGLVVAGATLAGAIGSASPAGAVFYNVNGTNYDITTVKGTYYDVQTQLTSASNVLWGNESLAALLAGVVRGELGHPNLYSPGFGVFGPLFAFRDSAIEDPTYYVGFTNVKDWSAEWLVQMGYVEKWRIGWYDNIVWGGDRNSVNTYATASIGYAEAVPWETDAISVIGSTTLFFGGLWARNKFAKPLQK
jgi:hypothetical protein